MDEISEEPVVSDEDEDYIVVTRSIRLVTLSKLASFSVLSGVNFQFY